MQRTCPVYQHLMEVTGCRADQSTTRAIASFPADRCSDTLYHRVCMLVADCELQYRRNLLESGNAGAILSVPFRNLPAYNHGPHHLKSILPRLTTEGRCPSKIQQWRSWRTAYQWRLFQWRVDHSQGGSVPNAAEPVEGNCRHSN